MAFQKAGDPVPPMSLFFVFPTAPKVQSTCESESRNWEGADGGEAESGQSTKQVKPIQDYHQNDVQENYTDSAEGREE